MKEQEADKSKFEFTPCPYCGSDDTGYETNLSGGHYCFNCKNWWFGDSNTNKDKP